MENAFTLIKSFLENWTFRVKVDGYLSFSYPLENGIPKGSPLSVMLYGINTNSLAEEVKNIPGIDYVGIYADNIFAVTFGNL